MDGTRTRDFDYEGLPFDEIEKLYKAGWGWRGIARHYGAPDHKTLAKHVLRHKPELESRNHAESQRARRARENRSSQGGAAAKQRRPWWQGGGER